MRIDKSQVVGLLRERGDHDKATGVECALPRTVDTEADAGILHQFDVHVSDLEADPEADPDAAAAGEGGG